MLDAIFNMVEGILINSGVTDPALGIVQSIFDGILGLF